MSIPAEPSLLQNEVQILNAKSHKQLIGFDGDNVLWLDNANLSFIALSFRCFFEGSALSVSKSHWHTRAVHTVMCLEREVVRRENW